MARIVEQFTIKNNRVKIDKPGLSIFVFHVKR